MPAWLRRIALACLLGLLASVVFAAPASAGTTAPSTRPVVFVHGFYNDHCPAGLNVASAMAGPMHELSSAGWTGREDVVAYYKCDVGGTRIASDTVNTPIETIAGQLAWYIYKTYSTHGQAVDIVSHSMGGLIVRAALQFTQNHSRSFPPYLLVARSVAFSSPFSGVPTSVEPKVPGLSGTYQGAEVLTGSSFVRTLQGGDDPDSTGWMVVGTSSTCDIVSGASAMALPGATTVLYTGCWSHTQYLVDTTATASYPAYINNAATKAYGSLKLMQIFLTMA